MAKAQAEKQGATSGIDVKSVDEILHQNAPGHVGDVPVPEPESEKRVRDPFVDEHECGLPLALVGRGSKMKIVAYCKQYEVSHAARRSLKITADERRLYRIYKGEVGKLAVSVDYFVAALTLWREGSYPVQKPQPRDLNALLEAQRGR